MPQNNLDLKNYLDAKAALYNQQNFIVKDPICVPHLYTLKQDIEISGLFAAVLAWGNRTTIINNSKRIMDWMGNQPYDFVLNHKDTDLKPFTQFVHRTFNATDLLYFISFLQHHYQTHPTLEDAFVPMADYRHENVGEALVHFHNYFFSIEHPARTKKHIATPVRNSACKRLNMYLRWMVRKDTNGVDFGLWGKISPSQLVCPLDVHVARVAHRLRLIENTNANWANATALTAQLKMLNPTDPVVYDFALFGLGAEDKL